MGIRSVLRRFFSDSTKAVQLQAEIRDGLANLASAASQANEVSAEGAGTALRSLQLQAEIREGIANLASAASHANEVSDESAETALRTLQLLAEIRQGVANLTEVTSRRFGEVRLGIENLATLVDKRMREQIALEKENEWRLEQRLRELTNGIIAQTPVAGDSVGIAAPHKAVTQASQPSSKAELTAVEIAPLRALPIPQLSLRRPNPVADLMATKEYRTYVEFFRSSPTVGQSQLAVEAHAIIYAFVRKANPETAVVVASDGAAVAETVARALLDGRGGRLYVYDQTTPDRSRSAIAAWPAELSRQLSFRGSTLAFAEPIDFAYAGGNDAEQLGPALDKLSAALRTGRLLAVGSNASDSASQAIGKFYRNHPDWTAWNAPQDEKGLPINIVVSMVPAVSHVLQAISSANPQFARVS